jgi:DNA-binding beta-propeller fold protein YncE
MKSRLSGWQFIGFILWFGVQLVKAQTAPELKTYVMDIDKKEVQALSMPSGNVLASAKMDKDPSLMLLSPDKTRLLVFQYSKKAHASVRRYSGVPILRFGAPTSLTIFDAGLKLMAKLEDVGWNAVAHVLFYWPKGEINAAWDSSGKRLTILAWGSKDKSPELVQLDVEKAAIVGRRPIACQAGEVSSLVQVSNDVATIFYAKLEKKKTAAAHTLAVIDLKNLDGTKEVSLSGTPREITGSPDGNYVYDLADDGPKITENGQAHTHILSIAGSASVQNIDGGFFHSETLSDPKSGLTFILRMGKKGTSTIFVFQGQTKKAEFEIPDVPLKARLASKTGRVYVLCYDSVQVIDIETLKLIGSIPAKHRTRGVWESGKKNRPPSDLAFNSNESIGILAFSGDDELTVLDLKELKTKEMIDLESGLSAFGKQMAVAAIMGAVGGVGGSFTGMYTVYVPAGSAPLTAEFTIDPTDQYLFILRAARVQVVDLNTYKKVSNISLSYNSQYLFFPPPQAKNSIFFVTGTHIGMTSKGSYRMDVVNMATREKVLEQEWRDQCQYTPDGKYAVNYDAENIYLLDGSTFSKIKTVGGYKDIRQIIIY